MKLKLLVAFALFISINSIEAKKVEGYVITKRNDTIFGTMKVSRFDLNKRTFSILSYDIDMLFKMVYFRQYGKKGLKDISRKMYMNMDLY